uniref:Kappa-casein n=1 Tax=Jaculus jaculus TaxID=51337 RepID=A0A8C5LEU1_JACJA
MRNFLLLVNILALTLPFLAAEVQNQEQLCREKNEQVFDRKRVLPSPVHYVLSSKAHYDPSYYQYRPMVAVSPYVPYQYFVRLLVLRPPVQLSNWQVLPNIPQPAGVPRPNPRPSFLAIPTNADPNASAIPSPTPVPAAEPVVSTVANPEVSTVASTATETATVPVTSPVP